MKLKYICTRFSITCFCALIISCANPVKDQQSIDSFIQGMVEKHHFNKASLESLFAKVELKEDIVKKIAKPSEDLPWYKYRRIFLKVPRIETGIQFWQQNEQTLAAVEKETGVPAAIIVAILGIETQYGQYTGTYRVIDALSSLAFDYPPRSQFFRSELEEFLLLCQEEHIDPFLLKGSYAGAMGIPQFMPSSYRRYAIDYNKDNSRDIWINHADVIASVANYFSKHGWKKDEAVIKKISEIHHKSMISPHILKENLSYIGSNETNPNISKPLLSTQKAKFIAFELEDGEELWEPSENFFVITRYNKSPLYALAVYQLSLAVSNQKAFSPYEKNLTNTRHLGDKRLFQQPVSNKQTQFPNPIDLSKGSNS